MTFKSSMAAAAATPSTTNASAQFAHAALRLLSALRYRKYLVLAFMLGSMALGLLYCLTAKRSYASRAVLLVSTQGPDRLSTAVANDKALRQNTMPTFENMVSSAKVLEGALAQLAPSDRIDLGQMSQEHCLAAIKKRLSVTTLRMTNILQVGYRSCDPQVAANVVRAVVNSYISFMDEMHKGTTGQLSRMLMQERGELARKLQQKQEELLAARRRFADMGFRGGGNFLHPMVQRAVFFNDALVAAQKQRAELEALMAALQDAVRNGQDIGQYLVSVADAVGRELLLNSLGLGNRAATQTTLEQGLLNDRARLLTLQQNLGAAHPEVLALAERIQRTEYYLQTAQQRITQRVARMGQSQLGVWLAEIVRQRLLESQQRVQMLQTHFEETRTAAINLSGQIASLETLERDVKRLRTMNDSLLNQIAAVDLKRNDAEVRVAVLEEPAADKRPVSPRWGRILLLAFLGGFGISLIAVNSLDAIDDRFRSPEELQSRLGLSVLSSIPHMKPIEPTGVGALVAFTAPTGAAAEGFRTLRTALALTNPDAHRLVVTSSEPEDGKTTTLANLAVCYAQAGKKTLLIDADLRRPGLTALLDLRGPRGLSAVLRHSGAIEAAAPAHIQHLDQPGLDVIPSGPRPANPAELLAGVRFSQLLAWAETVYDQILIDSPPILATTDTAIVGQLVDGALLVVRPDKNHRHLVLRASERLQDMRVAVLGVVVNGTGANDHHGYGYYGYHGYYGAGEAGYYTYDEDLSTQQPGAGVQEPEEATPDAMSVVPQDVKQLGQSRGVNAPRRVA